MNQTNKYKTMLTPVQYSIKRSLIVSRKKSCGQRPYLYCKGEKVILVQDIKIIILKVCSNGSFGALFTSTVSSYVGHSKYLNT